MTYENGPYIYVKSGEDVIYKMSRITWSNFAYFKMIVQDHLNKENPSNVIEIEFIDDVSDFWKFLKNDFPKEKVDFSLNVKTICITFGILDNKNIFWGRLKQLLLDSALEYFHKMEINLLLYPLNYNYNNFVENMNIRKQIQYSIVKQFTEITLEDPRCLDVFSYDV
tara:strand:+ start:3644 stop:4144 length:501 start_codon:yes stop_codon:yes gene_type:complete